MSTDERYRRGVEIRSRVLGQGYSPGSGVDPELVGDFERLSTQVAWGDVWARGVLDARERSLITLAMLLPMRADPQLALHIKGALNNGATRQEIAEVFIHGAVYCGFPVASAAFKTAQRVFDEMETS